MKKIIITLLTAGFLFSCSDLTELNDNQKKAKDAPAGTLFANAQKNVSDILASTNVNRGIWRLLAQYWTETTYNDESVYDLSTRNIPQNVWGILYRDVLKDLETARTNVLAIDPLFIDETVRQNQIQLIEIMEVYSWSILVNTYGDVPYSSATFSGGEALNIDIPSPKYEDAMAIYDDLAARLDAALTKLDGDADNFGDYDLLYEGDYASWIKFGNSLKLKLGMTLADVTERAAKARTMVEEAAPKAFASNADNAVIKYKDVSPNTNPVWVDLVQSGRKDFVAANTIINKMTPLDDPRLSSYFGTIDTIRYDKYEDGVPAEDAEIIDTVTVYYGGVYGSKNSYSRFSKPSELVKEPTFPGLLLDYVEVEFYLAEAAERGFNIDGDAKEHYDNAITASMEFWGVDAADITAYLAKPEVDYDDAPGTWQEKIGFQKWLALYNRGFEAWTEWRRLDAPTLVPPAGALSDIPLRYPYPVNEQNLNTKNYNDVVVKIVADKVSTRIFWDRP